MIILKNSAKFAELSGYFIFCEILKIKLRDHLNYMPYHNCPALIFILHIFIEKQLSNFLI